LHGAVLMGLAVTLVYLALLRAREQPLTAIAIGLATTAALCVTPAGLRTVTYYDGVLTNVAAARGQELWGPLSLSAPFDAVLIAAALALGSLLRRARPAGWELVVIVLLAASTIHASRSGIWLLLFLIAPAARAIRPRRIWSRLLPAFGTVAIATVGLAIVRGPLTSGGSRAIVARAISIAHGTPVLAEDIFAEQVALAGGRIWVGNPIDAFSRGDQVTYLDWIQGRPTGTRALNPRVNVVLVTRGSGAQRLMDRAPSFSAVTSDQKTELYVRTH
jgi:hypothetical protein